MSLETDTFPFRRYVSLAPLVEFWKRVASGDGRHGGRSAQARWILDQIEGIPHLLSSHEDIDALLPLRDEVALLACGLFPFSPACSNLGAVVAPFQFCAIYETEDTSRLGVLEALSRLPDTVLAEIERRRAMHAYHFILEQGYGIGLEADDVMTLPLARDGDALPRWYRIRIEPDFCQVRVAGTWPSLSEDDIQRLLEEPMDLERWSEKLPAETFEFHGVVILRAEDVTEQKILSQIKRELLQRGALTSLEHVIALRDSLRSLFGCEDLNLGLISTEFGAFDVGEGISPVGQSLLLGGGGLPACRDPSVSTYARAVEADQPVILYDLQRIAHPTEYEAYLRNAGFRNLVLAPLRSSGRLVGVMEIGSAKAGALHQMNTALLPEVMDLVSTTLQRSFDEREDRIQAIIKEHYTAIHPVVEWRFREVARSYLRGVDAEGADGGSVEADETALIEPIVFRDVFPLYGMSDIRGSSTQRNAAIQEDLVDQLGLALNILVEAGVERWLPALDELGYRITTFAQDIAGRGMSAGDEVRVLDFLRREVQPLLSQLEGFGPRTSERVAAYRAALDPDLGVVYRRRKEFEECITRINDTISGYIERQEAVAQTIVPHYFEKYKTDGVDYNIYAGTSIVEDSAFTTLHLHSLRLWQIMMMCGVVWELDALKDELTNPLDVTHLILVHNAPLAIRFRQDEKQFDVDGAYNIRYEIVKKRIDKATVRVTGERLTQPGNIAIVYEHDRDAEEYRRYIDYLKAAQYVESEVEDVALEDLQGVSGLRALRVVVRSDLGETEGTRVSPAEALQGGMRGKAPQRGGVRSQAGGTALLPFDRM